MDDLPEIDDIAALHERVHERIDTGDLGGATNLILEAREKGVLQDLDAGSFGGWMRTLAEIAWRQGRRRRAKRLVTTALQLQQDQGGSAQDLGHSWFLLAEIEHETGHSRPAQRSAGYAVRRLDAARDPALIEANELLGQIRLERGHPRKAAESFEAALDGMEAFEVVDRKLRHALLEGLVDALDMAGDVEGACDARTRQVSSCEGPLEQADTLNELALLEIDLDRPELAGQHFREALRALNEQGPVSHPVSAPLTDGERDRRDHLQAVAIEGCTDLLVAAGKLAEGLHLYRRNWLQTRRRLDPEDRAYHLAVLTELEVAAGKHRAARRHLLHLLALEGETEQGWERSNRLDRGAAAALEMGDIALAVRLQELPTHHRLG